MQSKRQQKGFFTIAITMLLVTLLGTFVLSSLALSIVEEKKKRLSESSRQLAAIGEQAMSIYAKNVLEIEGGGTARNEWLAAPERFLSGAQIPKYLQKRRIGAAISPVRSYVGEGTLNDRAQYFAYTRVVLYILDDALNADMYRPAFTVSGELRPCGLSIEADQACPIRNVLHELPTASWQAERLETAIRQVETMASLLVTYFNTQVQMDPVHEMASNHFRDSWCTASGGSAKVPIGRLPCLTGFVSMEHSGSQLEALKELVQRAGITATGLSEFYYPWGTDRAAKLELANEEGLISGAAGWYNTASYPFTMTIRQPLPWPAPDGSIAYIKATAVQP